MAKSLTPTSTPKAAPALDSLTKILCGAFGTLPNDSNLSLGVFLKCIDIIKTARSTSVRQGSKRIEVPYLRLIQGAMPAKHEAKSC
jgi:hypothetical protein